VQSDDEPRQAADRLRLFCGLRLRAETIDALVAWQARELGRGVVAGGRLVPAASLHLTLAFLGHRPAGELAAVSGALRAAAAAYDVRLPLRLTVRGYRETRSVGMLTFDDEGDRAGALARRLHERLEELGVYRREERPWLPHLTVLRFRDRPRLRPPLPELATVVPSDAAVYISRLQPGGAQYEVLENVALG
jgi:RNA 2',3'-cyclic 3'-phosphodiesterase